MKSIIRFFTPLHYAKDKTLLRKARFFVAMSLWVEIMILSFSVANFYFNQPFAGYSSLIDAIAYTFLLFSFKSGKLSLWWVVNLFSLFSFLNILNMFYNTGGQYSLLPWFTINTILPLMIAGKRSGIFWTAISFLTFSLVIILNSFDYQFPHRINENAVPMFNYWVIIGFGCCAYGLVAEYEIAKRKAMKKVSLRSEEISAQTDIIQEKQKEILDSIHYAKKIQETILPSEKLVKQYLPDSFILYKPKDIVSGDFYWITKWGTKVLFAAVDCTRHGVPGAFMSIVGQNLLNRTVNEYGLTQPNLILDQLNKGISKAFNQNNAKDKKDEMDIALCSFDVKHNKLQYSGANNHLWIHRDNDIIEIKADEMSIGSYAEQNNTYFTHHEIKLVKNDIVYIFSDGYSNQFGNEKDKKQKSKEFKHLLLSIAHKPLSEQKKILNNTITNIEIERNEEQLDDIVIVAIKV